MIGLLGSLHCVGMCGPIALALPLNRLNKKTMLGGVFTYNFGRVITYSLIGVAFGFIGGKIAFFGYQQILSIALGVLIILSAILPYSFERLFEITPAISSLLAQLKAGLGSQLKNGSFSSLLTIGLLNGFLPCGLVYFAVMGATSQYGIVEGALYMAIFGLGTLPAMLLVAISPTFITVRMRNKVKKALPYLAILIGIIFILRGLNLGIPYVSPEFNQKNPDVVECHE